MRRKDFRVPNLIGTFSSELLIILPVLYLARHIVVDHPGFFIPAGIGYLLSVLIYIKRH